MSQDYDHYRDDERDEGDEDVQCRRCHQRGFTWHHTGLRWALLDDDNKIHECGTVARTSDFEDLTGGKT